MGWYSKYIFPCLYDPVMDRPFWAKYRREQLAGVDGEILEIGAGTGLNLPHYPPHVRKITTVDPNPGMNKRLRRRSEQTEIEIDQRMIRGESLPFESGGFDCVVSTLTLCSIPDVEQAISEVHRVLKSGGRFFFLEHGLSSDPKVAKWQRRLNRLQHLLADGCTLTLDVPQLLSTRPFNAVELDTFYMERTPKIHGFMFRGVATK